MTDHYSRRVLTCHGLRSVKTVDAKPIFRALFREVGLPDAIRTDNGAPFASTGIHGLAALNVWWMQLGIVHQRTRQRVRKNTAPTSGCIASASARRPAARQPASGLNSVASTPSASATTTSGHTKASATARRAPSGVPRRARTPNTARTQTIRAHGDPTRQYAGTFRLQSRQPFLSHALSGEDIGLEEVGDGIWNIVYDTTLLGKIDDRTARITGIRPGA